MPGRSFLGRCDELVGWVVWGKWVGFFVSGCTIGAHFRSKQGRQAQGQTEPGAAMGFCAVGHQTEGEAREGRIAGSVPERHFRYSQQPTLWQGGSLRVTRTVQAVKV